MITSYIFNEKQKIYNSYKKLHDPLWFVTDFPGWSKVKMLHVLGIRI